MLFADVLDALTREGLEELESALRYAYHRQWRALELPYHTDTPETAPLPPARAFDNLRTVRGALARTRDAIACLPAE